jgi:hypothetical protein
MLTVKPIPGYEEYAYYPDVLCISFEYCNLTNEDLGATPLSSIIIAEKHKGNEQAFGMLRPIHEKIVDCDKN